MFSRVPRATLASLPPPDAPGLLAIFVPAWREEAVIGRMLVSGLALGFGAGPALAQRALPIAQILKDGYEVKAAFADSAGSAYIVLQKGTSAYLCHSSPSQVCEKLN